MSVKFVIDSASDVLPQQAQELGVTHLPMQVLFGEDAYKDAIDLTHQEFYEKLADCKELPTTSQIAPAAFSSCFEQLVSQGHEVVVITISSKLSGTYQSAVIAAADYPGKVFPVDSLSATVGERILLQRGLELAQQGLSAEEIANALNEEKPHIRLVAMIDTLEYLKKGGRISSTVALAGSLLAIRPGIEVKDGEVAMAGTARGSKKCHALLKENIEKHGGINWEKPVALVYANSDDQLQQFIAATPELWNGQQELPIHSLGCVIGAHIGPGAYGIAFFDK